ncbi:CAP domain-containing protein [Rhodoblastus acidophilus]|uniref:CAP domain-containing protein n=1 Tax=Candidatus Rhodoblastus alkanivorans TaxID=2954117 RepID=A0ABS9Z2Q7_9HYPH|nr:CAP domain-containing protein [Candidatus Rhodoblastus alkanivorans]MCI4677538.1 CAP domain-containing protein [Candidatus Rhodoblastus alkanivorans]MCI4681897.1 CAP domain-containing protein [Candidatus Rhodoblastus alkanivorans]MDI4642947.1 CAP domain-containing protein [Rhodoblastus acidophilus]
MPRLSFPAVRFALAAAPFCLLLAGCAETAPPARPEAGLFQSMAEPGATLDVRAARDMISLYRRNHGLSDVTIDPGLTAQAKAQSDAMAARDKLSHELSGTLTQRLDRAGYEKNKAVENVSAGYDTMAEAFSGWRQSPPHNANLLAPGMKRMGIAAAYNPKSRYKVFWTLDMAN